MTIDVFTIDDPVKSITGNIEININDILTVRFSFKIFKISIFIFHFLRII